MADRKKGHTRESNASVAEGQEETPKPSVTFLSSYTGLGAPDRRAKKTFSFSGLNLNIPENRASPSMKPTRPVFGVSAPGVKPPFTHPPTMRPPTSNGEMCKTSKTVHSTPMSATARIPPTLSPAPWQGQMPPGKTMVGSALVSQEQQISGTQEPFTLMPRRFIPEQVQLPQQFGSVTPHVASKQKLTNFTSNVRQTQQEKTVTRDALRIEAFELGSMEGPISGFEDDPLERFTTNVKQESIFDLDCLPEDIDFNEAPSETTKRRRRYMLRFMLLCAQEAIVLDKMVDRCSQSPKLNAVSGAPEAINEVGVKGEGTSMMVTARKNGGGVRSGGGGPPGGSGKGSSKAGCGQGNAQEPSSVFPNKKSKGTASLLRLYEIDSDPERRKFLDELLDFMEKRSTPIVRCPILGQKPVDLFRLYLNIKGRGGFTQCNRSWKNIAEEVGISQNTNVAYSLKKIYEKDLLPFENIAPCSLNLSDLSSKESQVYGMKIVSPGIPTQGKAKETAPNGPLIQYVGDTSVDINRILNLSQKE